MINFKKLNAFGFSLMELIVVMALMGIVLGIAAPSFMAWRANLYFRQAANGFVANIRTARSAAISTNRESILVIDTVNNKYRLKQGNRAFGSSSLVDLPRLSGDINVPSNVIITSTLTNVIFSPNGTISGLGGTSGFVAFKETSGITRYTVTIQQTGRVLVN
jgi:prepilin-type N-terminal cleavage/methylation domain-containing protein